MRRHCRCGRARAARLREEKTVGGRRWWQLRRYRVATTAARCAGVGGANPGGRRTWRRNAPHARPAARPVPPGLTVRRPLKSSSFLFSSPEAKEVALLAPPCPSHLPKNRWETACQEFTLVKLTFSHIPILKYVKELEEFVLTVSMLFAGQVYYNI